MMMMRVPRWRAGLGRRVSAPTVAAGSLVALLLLAGCAPEPLPHWDTPQRDAVPGVMLLSAPDVGVASESADADSLDDAETDADTDRESSTGTGTGGGAGQVTPTVPLQLTPTAADMTDITDALLPLRLRHDGVGIAARFVAVPGVPAFSERVNDMIRQEIAASGVAYRPTVFDEDAGLGERGCVSGSVSWPAAKVLRNPETAPPNGSGVSVTCEILEAFSDTLVIAVRTVAGTPEQVKRDRTVKLSVNVATGEVAEGQPQWRETAPTELWLATVELLRREAGALGNAALEPPSAEQVAIARSALDVATLANDGGMVVTLPPGITSPELEGFGVPANTHRTEVHIDAEQAYAWSSDHRRAVLRGTLEPFRGITAEWQSVQPDCELLPCVAVTYDDGPGPLTPELLEALAGERGLATFYMLGSAARGAPGVVRDVADAGHEIGSHTMTHPDLTLIGGEAARAQVHDAANLLRELSGEPVTTYRPPYGAVNDEVLTAVDMPAINWSIDTNDWRHPGVDALIERSVPEAQPGSIILFHDIHPDTVAVADDVFAGLHNRGFVTVTVSQLFGGTVPNALLRER